MSFILSWISSAPGTSLVVANAGEALREARKRREDGALQLVVRNDDGDKVTTDELRQIAEIERLRMIPAGEKLGA